MLQTLIRKGQFACPVHQGMTGYNLFKQCCAGARYPQNKNGQFVGLPDIPNCDSMGTTARCKLVLQTLKQLAICFNVIPEHLFSDAISLIKKPTAWSKSEILSCT